MSNIHQLRDDCEEDQKIVISPIYHGRLEESSTRTTRGRSSWYNLSLPSLFGATPTQGGGTTTVNQQTSNQTVLTVMFVLLSLLLVFITGVLIWKIIIARKSG